MAAGDVLDERDGSVDEENESTRPQEQPKPGVDDIFDCDKRTGNHARAGGFDSTAILRLPVAEPSSLTGQSAKCEQVRSGETA